MLRRVCDSARCQRKTVWKIVCRDFPAQEKSIFVRTLGVFWDRDREREYERERVRSPCAPCTLCQSISLPIPLSIAASLSLSSCYSPSILPLSLSSLLSKYILLADRTEIGQSRSVADFRLVLPHCAVPLVLCSVNVIGCITLLIITSLGILYFLHLFPILFMFPIRSGRVSINSRSI